MRVPAAGRLPLSPPVCPMSRPMGRVGPWAAAATLITFFFFPSPPSLFGNARPGHGAGTPRPATPAYLCRAVPPLRFSPLLPCPSGADCAPSRARGEAGRSPTPRAGSAHAAPDGRIDSVYNLFFPTALLFCCFSFRCVSGPILSPAESVFYVFLSDFR